MVDADLVDALVRLAAARRLATPGPYRVGVDDAGGLVVLADDDDAGEPWCLARVEAGACYSGVDPARSNAEMLAAGASVPAERLLERLRLLDGAVRELLPMADGRPWDEAGLTKIARARALVEGP